MLATTLGDCHQKESYILWRTGGALEITETLFHLLKEKLSIKGSMEFEVITGSMEPLIKVGEKVTVSKLRPDHSLKRFDVIVYWTGKNLICHYVWLQNEGQYANEKSPRVITRPLGKGEDFPIRQDSILGWVPSKKIPFFRKLRIIIGSVGPAR